MYFERIYSDVLDFYMIKIDLTHEFFVTTKTLKFDFRIESRGGQLAYATFQLDIIETPDFGIAVDPDVEISTILTETVLLDKQKDPTYSSQYCSHSDYYCFEDNELGLKDIPNSKNTFELI